MGRFLVGVLVGVAVAAGGLYAWQGRAPCLGRCGDGARCDGVRCVPASPAPVAAAPPTAPARKRRRGGGGSGSGATATGGGDAVAPAAPEVQLRPGDEKPLAQGDALGRPEHIDLSQPGDDAHALDEDVIDRVMRSAEPRITGCITTAVGDAPLDTARVEVGVRIEKDGAVSKVRVTAPTLLQRNGLTRCVRGIVTSLRFPRSGGASVATYPYDLR